MCIIVSKEKGVDLPSKKTLETCFKNNPDGAGMMYVRSNRVVIDKGYMTFNDFYKRLKEVKKEFGSDLKDKAIVFHFRIGTSGKNDKATTHPFPVIDNKKELRMTNTTTDLGVVHNGIISKYVYGELSDTQNFIGDYLAVFKELNNNFYKNDSVQHIINDEVRGKLCFLDKDENIVYIGDFVIDNGVKYSNENYKPKTYSYYNYPTTYDSKYYDRKYNYNDWDDYSGFDEYAFPIKKDKYDEILTLQDFIDMKIKYEVLNIGDVYEVNGIDGIVEDNDFIVIDEDYNLYESINDDCDLSLIGTDVMVLNSDYSLKQLSFEVQYCE